MLTEVLQQLVERRDLSPEILQQSLRAIMQGQCAEAEVAAFLTALRMKGETPDELAAAAGVLREHMIRLEVGERDVLDTCGTGGDGLGTFNISTATALVVAGCGVSVVKHGNRGVSSACGSADVFTALGVKIDAEPAVIRRCLEETNLCFCFAPKFHPAMRHVAGVRKQLRFRTIFNLLGPLCNPAGARYQLLGVGRLELLERMAQCLARLRPSNALVVCGRDGLDEVTLTGPTLVQHVQGNSVRALEWTPGDFDLPPCRLEELRAGDAAESAARVRRVIEGEPGAARNIVLANAAAALLAANQVSSLREGVARASQAIREGQALRVLERLVVLSHEAGIPSQSGGN